MGRGSSKVKKSTSTTQTTISNVPVGAGNLSDADVASLRQQEDSMYTANTTAAIKMYISNTDFDNQGHSLSQTMNYLLDEGDDIMNDDVATINKRHNLNLTNNDLASMQYTYTRMNAAYHPIGKDAKLQRGAHDELLKKAFGINDYSKMSESQLQNQLVGKTFRNVAPMSTSYNINKNPFLSSSSGVSGGREVVFNISAGKNTPSLLGAKKQSEIILGQTNWKITGVKYTGNYAMPRGKAPKKQIQIDIETY